MEYPVYYELNFDGFKKYAEFMWHNAHEIVDKAFLSPQEITIMKEMVTEAVEKYNERVDYSPYYQVSLKDFGIQYVGYFNAKGEKLIWINGFTKKSPFHSSNDSAGFEAGVVFVLDGGNGYFETVINLTTGEADGIRIHGSA